MDTTAIQLTHITKEYIIHHEKPTLVEKFYRSSAFGKEEKFIALNDISLTVKKGERIGIIGPNGSGKTTLLKIIAGITTPTNGTVTRKGKLVSLIDLEAGFHPDLTGLQNIFLNGMLLGMNKREIKNKLHSIIRFADINQFIDAPMFTYSSGMALRLGFSVAIHADPDILVLDENLTVGDKFFQEKAKMKLNELFSRDITCIIVSHVHEFLEQYCKRYIIIKNGTVCKDGSHTVMMEYIKMKK